MRSSVLVFSALLVLGVCLRFGAGQRAARNGKEAVRDSSTTHPPMAETDARPAPSSRSDGRPDQVVATLRNLLSHAASLPHPQGLDPDVVDRLRAKLDARQPDELLAILRELDASNAPRTERMRLESMIFGALARRDPSLALDTFAGRVPERLAEGRLRQLQFAYDRWLSQDIAAAAKWLDRRAAEGALGRDSEGTELLTRLEFSLLRALAARDAEAASARFAAMDGEARRAAFQGDWFPPLPEERETAVAEFLREHADDPAAAFAQAASARLRQGTLADSASFLNRLDPSPEERAAMVDEALRTRLVNRDELLVTPEEARHWIREQAPDAADRLSGAALARFVEWHGFPGMAELALAYRDESGSDEALAAFLKEAPASHRREILELAGELADPVRREAIRSRFPEAAPPSPESP